MVFSRDLRGALPVEIPLAGRFLCITIIIIINTNPLLYGKRPYA